MTTIPMPYLFRSSKVIHADVCQGLHFCHLYRKYNFLFAMLCTEPLQKVCALRGMNLASQGGKQILFRRNLSLKEMIFSWRQWMLSSANVSNPFLDVSCLHEYSWKYFSSKIHYMWVADKSCPRFPSMIYHNLFIILLPGSKAEPLLGEQPCCIQRKIYRLYRKVTIYTFLGSIFKLCLIQNCVIVKCVIKRFMCICQCN